MADIEKIQDSYGNIERYYKNQGKLTKREQELVERWETAWSLLRANRNKIVAQKKYKSLMLNKGIVLSDNDVYKDFRYCVELFAPISKTSFFNVPKFADIVYLNGLSSLV